MQFPVVTGTVSLQSKFQDHFNQLIPGYYIVVVRIELLENIAAEIHTLFMQQALGKGNELAPRNHTVLINVEDIK